MTQHEVGVEATRANNGWLGAAQARIDAQTRIIESLAPGSRAHRTASEVLLSLQDSLHVMTEAYLILALARRLDQSGHQL